MRTETIQYHLETCDESILMCPIKLEQMKNSKDWITRINLMDEFNEEVESWKREGTTIEEINDVLKDNCNFTLVGGNN